MPGQAMLVVDASVWVSRLVPQDHFYPAVSSWMAEQRAADVLLVSPALLLPEVGGAISRRTGSPELASRTVAALVSLPTMRLVEMERELVADAARLAAEVGLRGADAVYAALAIALNLPLVTLNDNQAQRASGKVQVRLLNSSSD